MRKTIEELAKRFLALEEKSQKLKLQHEELMRQIDELRAEDEILMGDIKEALREL